jgi:hypothetical protein
MDKENDKSQKKIVEPIDIDPFKEFKDTFLKSLNDSIGHITVGVVGAWLIGYFGFHFLFLLFLLFAVWKLDQRRQDRNWRRKWLALEREKKRKEYHV